MREGCAATATRTKVYFDGGCRPNPGPIEAAVVLRGAVHVHDDLGHGSNSDAEWLALICALRLVRGMGLGQVTLLGDAAEIILRANEALQTGKARSVHAGQFLDLASGVPGLRIRWIKRSQNFAGIALAARHPR